jgi:hypothetical protein
MQSSTPPTMLEPQDLEFLQACFDEVRREHGLSDRTRVATDVAAQMIELYQNGIRDPSELTRRLSL